MTKWLCLAAGSLSGGFARYLLSEVVHKNFGTAFPYGTLAVNLLGCLAIGFLSTIADDKLFLGSEGRILLVTGFCGAFTTFSAFMLETGTLADNGKFYMALLNVILSVAAGFLVFRLGVLLGGIK